MNTQILLPVPARHNALGDNEAAMRVETYAQIGQDAAVLYCLGEMTANDSGCTLRATVVDLLRRYRNVIIDLSRIHYIDSSGLGILVGLYSSARSFKSVLKYRNLTTVVDYGPRTEGTRLPGLKQAS